MLKATVCVLQMRSLAWAAGRFSRRWVTFSSEPHHTHAPQALQWVCVCANSPRACLYMSVCAVHAVTSALWGLKMHFFCFQLCVSILLSLHTRCLKVCTWVCIGGLDKLWCILCLHEHLFCLCLCLYSNQDVLVSLSLPWDWSSSGWIRARARARRTEEPSGQKTRSFSTWVPLPDPFPSALRKPSVWVFVNPNVRTFSDVHRPSSASRHFNALD